MRTRRTPARWATTFTVLVVAALLAVPALLAQIPSGTLTGRVTDEQGGSLPGVTVTATSPNLQGSRVTTTGVNGDYKLPSLPPGTYRLSYELEGFNTIVREVKISAAQSTSSDIQMQLATVVEEIVVSGTYTAISEDLQGAATFTVDEVEKLPVARNYEQTLLLAPGVTESGVGSDNNSPTITIAGAPSYENLFLLNGVVMNENVRGQAFDLFIEDAIQEMTVQASGISAEYGRFSGGVVNAITKSGGNRFEGSLRVSFTNDDWMARNELSPERKDEVVDTEEATLGGYFVKDHLWFFLAGRDREVSEADQTRARVTDAVGNVLEPIPFTFTNPEERYEAKLTISPHPSHNLVGSYFEIDEVQGNQGSFTFIDLRSLNNRKLPQEMKVGNYTGILTPNFFIEAQYSEREFFFQDSGSKTTDLLEGTLMRRRGTSHRWHSPTFCGAGPPRCPDEERSNENFLAKGSYFLSSQNAGTHDLVFGYDTFDDIRFSINRQTGSDFTVWASDILVNPATNDIFSQFNGTDTWIGWWAVFNEDIAQPTSFTTNSYYLNDRWRLNDKWSFNLGVRYDENDGQNSSGNLVASDDKVSPRLGLSYDVKGDGDLVINASLGTYTSAVTNSLADQTTTGGAIGVFLSSYGGPTVNSDPACLDRGDCIPTSEALGILFDWYFANGGTMDVEAATADPLMIPGIFSISIPGVTSIIEGTMKSPAADEFTVGFTKRLGTRGMFRADAVYREWEDFYGNRTELGRTSSGTDLELVGNFDDGLEREYMGLHTQFRYRVTDRLNVAANYTLSNLEGNIVGETGPSGPVPSTLNTYPEYRERRWNAPVGDLRGDRRHRLRAWAIYDIFDTDHHNLSVSWLENYFSGQPFGAVGSIDPIPFVDNPGYLDPPDDLDYWFTARDAFRTDDVHASDIAFNYSFIWKAFGRELQVFIQPEILNIFDEDAVLNGFGLDEEGIATSESASSTCTAISGAPCQAFNPFTETPVEGVNWAKRAGFGEPEDEEDFQLPRTFRISVGFRF